MMSELYPPNTYPSQFEMETEYTFQIERRGKAKNGSHYLQLAFNPTNKEGFARGTMWFNPPGDERYQPHEYALIQHVAGIPDNGTFKATRKGKPWYWEVDGTPLKSTQEGPQEALELPQTTPQTQTQTPPPQATTRPPAGPGENLPDLALLFSDCVAKANKIVPLISEAPSGKVPDICSGPLRPQMPSDDTTPGHEDIELTSRLMTFQVADTLFRVACVKGLSMNYQQNREKGGISFDDI